jgi:hypothetical protein
MKEKLLAVWAQVQALAAKAMGWSPLAVGIVLGYFGKPLINIAISLVADLIKAIF